MTQFRYPGVKMPTVNGSGYTLGGNMWVSQSFNPSSISTLTGIVIDPDGNYMANYFDPPDYSHKGIMVWDDGDKVVEIVNEGMHIKGGTSSWIPGSWVDGNTSTHTGVTINSDGITGWKSGSVTFAIHNATGSFEFGPTGKQIAYNATTGMVSMFALSTEILTTGNLSTGSGILFHYYGIEAYSAGNRTFYLEADTGKITIGQTAGKQLIYDPLYDTLTVPAAQIGFIDTALMTAGSLSTGTGLLLSVDGLRGYKSLVQTFYLESATGNFTFGTSTGKQMIFNASTGTLTVGGSFVGTVATYLSTAQLAAGTPPATGVVIDNAGIRAYASSTKTLDIESSGSFTIGATAGNQLIFNASTGYLGLGSLVSSTGILFNESGIQGLKSGVQTFYLESASGNFTFGSVAGKTFAFNATTGVMTIGADVTITSGTTAGTAGYAINGASRAYLGLNSSGYAVLEISSDTITHAGSNPTNGVILDTNGLRGYGSGVQTFGISSSTGAAFFKGDLNGASVSSGGVIEIATSGGYGAIRFTSVGNIYGASGSMSIVPVTASSGTCTIGASGQRWIYVDLYASSQITLGAPTIFIPGAISASSTLTVADTANLNGLTLAHHIYPAAENSYDIGESNTTRWWRNLRVKTVTTNDFYAYESGIHLAAGSGNYISDGYDDLALLDAIAYELDEKGEIVKNEKGETKMDIMSYPDHCLDFAAVAKTINESKLTTAEVTKEDAKAIIAGTVKHEAIDPETLKDKVCLDFGSIRGLQIGAIRQLNKKLDTFIGEINEWKNKQEATTPK